MERNKKIGLNAVNDNNKIKKYQKIFEKKLEGIKEFGYDYASQYVRNGRGNNCFATGIIYNELWFLEINIESPRFGNLKEGLFANNNEGAYLLHRSKRIILGRENIGHEIRRLFKSKIVIQESLVNPKEKNV